MGEAESIEVNACAYHGIFVFTLRQTRTSPAGAEPAGAGRERSRARGTRQGEASGEAESIEVNACVYHRLSPFRLGEYVPGGSRASGR